MMSNHLRTLPCVTPPSTATRVKRPKGTGGRTVCSKSRTRR